MRLLTKVDGTCILVLSENVHVLLHCSVISGQKAFSDLGKLGRSVVPIRHKGSTDLLVLVCGEANRRASTIWCAFLLVGPRKKASDLNCYVFPCWRS